MADPDAYLRAQTGKLVVVDEIHRAPDLFGTLRGIIDERRRADKRAGHFLLLGSASLDLMKQASETLAGRGAYVELAPIDAIEAGEAPGGVSRLWSRGGFPDSLLAKMYEQPRLASRFRAELPRKGRSDVRAAAPHLLVDLLLVRRLRPWSGDVGKRLVRTPKTYVRDSGLVRVEA